MKKVLSLVVCATFALSLIGAYSLIGGQTSKQVVEVENFSTPAATSEILSQSKMEQIVGGFWGSWGEFWAWLTGKTYWEKAIPAEANITRLVVSPTPFRRGQETSIFWEIKVLNYPYSIDEDLYKSVEGSATLSIHNLAGQTVKSWKIANFNVWQRYMEGTQKWNGKNDSGNNVAGGTYFAQIRVNLSSSFTGGHIYTKNSEKFLVL